MTTKLPGKVDSRQGQMSDMNREMKILRKKQKKAGGGQRLETKTVQQKRRMPLRACQTGHG